MQVAARRLRAAKFDLADLAGRQAVAVRADDAEVLVQPGRTDAADAPLADMIAGDDAAFAHPVELYQLDAVGVFEAFVLFHHQRRGR